MEILTPLGDVGSVTIFLEIAKDERIILYANHITPTIANFVLEKIIEALDKIIY